MFRWSIRLLIMLIVAGVAATYWVRTVAERPLAFATSQPAGRIEFAVPPGSSLRAIGRTIAAAGVPIEPWQLEIIARLDGKAAQLKAGSYAIDNGITLRALIDKLARGDVLTADVRFVEGWTFRQMRKALADALHVRHESTALDDNALLRALGVTDAHPEGIFFPDTYVFARGTSDIAIYKLAYQAMQKHLTAAWAGRPASSPLKTPYDTLILASIIEKETGKSDERGLVSAVFVNRLRSGMRLQTDPTIIYGLGSRFDGNLRKRDLQADGPYNTYTRAGLPPTPIALPGRASIDAALRPASSDALYFVARGDGSSEFSRTLEEHNRAVAKFQLRGGR